MLREAAPQMPQPPSPEGRRLVGDYAAPSAEARERHVREIAEVEAQIHKMEERLHELNEKSPIGKLVALVLEHPTGGELDRLHRRLAHLKADPLYTKSETH